MIIEAIVKSRKGKVSAEKFVYLALDLVEDKTGMQERSICYRTNAKTISDPISAENGRNLYIRIANIEDPQNFGRQLSIKGFNVLDSKLITQGDYKTASLSGAGNN